VLAALLVDDARALVLRRFGSNGTRAFAAVLAIAAAFAFWSNADTLFNDIAGARGIQQVYATDASRIYTFCNQQRERGQDNFSVGFINHPRLAGLAKPHETFPEVLQAWSDSAWVCHDIDGVQLAAPEEAWPLQSLPEGVAVTFGFSDPLAPIDDVAAQLQRAYPGIGPPEVIRGPGDYFLYAGWRFDNAQALGPRGLYGEYFPSGFNEPVATRVDPVNDLSWDEQPDAPTLPFDVRWQGLVYLPEGGQYGLVALATGAATVVVDGRQTFPRAPLDDTPEPITLDLAQGWHTVEISLTKTQPGGSLQLLWTTPDRRQRPLALDDLFPLRTLNGWVHERVLGQLSDRALLTTQRIDFAPHESLPVIVETSAPPDLVRQEAFLTEERWRGVWNTDVQGDYALRVEFRQGTVSLLIDGQEIAASRASGPRRLDAIAALTPGPHTIEIVQTFEQRPLYAGVTLSLTDAPPGSSASLSDVVPYQRLTTDVP
jgi:hypothetical protein